MAEGLAAALKIDAPIIADLDKAQQTITMMADAAERLGKGFSTFSQSFINTMNAANGKNFIASFDTSGALKNLQVLTDAVAQANLKQQGAAKSNALSEESLNKKLENIFSKRADTYAAITQRIKDLKDYQDKWNQGSQNSVNNGGPAFDATKYQEAEKYLKALQDRLRDFNAEFNLARADNMGTNAVIMPTDTYQEALAKIQALTAAEREFLKPGGDSAQNAATITDSLKFIRDEIDRTKAQLPTLKQAADDALMKDKAEAVRTKFADAMGLTEKDITDMEEKIRRIKEAYNSLYRESGKNDYVFAMDVAYAKEEMDRLISRYEAKKKAAGDLLKSDKADATRTKFADAIGLSEDNISEMIEKMRRVKEAYKELYKESGKNSFISPTEVAAAKDELDKLIVRYDEMRKRLGISEAEGALTAAIGAKATDIEGIRTKLTEVERSIAHLKSVAGASADPTLIAAAEKEAESLRTKLEISSKALGVTAKAAASFGNVIKGAFSTLAIGSFLNNIVKVRSEFEMAEKSIGIIIRDANMAKDIFNQIQDIAIKSPFQIKDLVKQTKQLAAYRIETDKLVETTKMLGDISAGVGVDMNRLILAFGQVKATTYLKGTELRQFSEAGVNMLDGLAKRFSEVQDRAVSTGEVLQMVSKRMVSFEDVNAVLQQQTAAGGTFYKMQEKQAETLQGRISNIKDKMDVMYNEIGKSSQGFMVLILNIIDTLIANYKVIEPILTGAVAFAAMAALLTTGKKVWNLGKNFVALIGMIKTESLSAIGTLKLTTPVIAGVAAAIAALATVIIAATKLQRELKKAAKEAEKDNLEMMASYDNLARRIANANSSMSERSKALDELKAQFGNILPLEDENINTIKASGEKYREHAAAIRESNAELLRENQILTVQRNIAETTQKRVNNVWSAIKDAATWYEENEGYLGADDLVGDVGGYGTEAFFEVQEKILDGEIKSAEEAAQEYLKLIDEFYGYSDGFTEAFMRKSGDLNTVVNQLQKVFNKLGKLDKAAKSAPTLYSDMGFSGQELAEAIKNIGKYKDAWMEFHRWRHDGAGHETELDPEFEGNEAKLEQAANAAVLEYKDFLVKAIKNGSNVASGQMGDEFGHWFTTAIDNGLNETQQKRLVELLDDTVENVVPGPIENRLQQVFSDINDKFPNLAQKFGTGSFMINAGESAASFTKRMVEMLDTAENGVSVWEKFETAEDKLGVTNEQMEASLGGSEQQLRDLATALETVLLPVLELMGLHTKDDTKSTKDLTNEIRSFVEAVVGASDKLEELNYAGDALLMSKLEAMSKKVGIALPKTLDEATVEEWVKTLQARLGEDYFDIMLDINTSGAEKALEKLRKKEDELWEKYNIAKEFEEYGVTLDGYDSAALFKQLMDLEAQYRAQETKDGEESAEELKKKRLEKVREEQKEAAKVIYEAQKKATTEVEQIYQKMYEDIGTIRAGQQKAEDGTQLDEEMANAGISAITKKAMEDINKAEWEAYKSTEMYAMAFGDLGTISNEVLIRLRDDLEAFKASGSLNPSDMRALENAIVKINKEIEVGSRGKEWFGTMADGFSAITDAYKKYKKEIPTLESALNTANKNYDDAKARRDQALADATANPDNEWNKNRLAEAEKNLSEATLARAKAYEKLRDAYDDVSNSLDGADKKLSEMNDMYDKVGSAVSEVIGLVKEVADAFGLDISDETNAVLDGFEQGFGLVGSAISVASTAVIGLTAAMVAFEVSAGAILWPLLAVGAALGTIIAIIKGNDAALEAKIESHKEAVERLEKAYEELEERMDEALSMSEIAQTYANQMSNLRQQYAELNEAIVANNQRKQNDEVKEETEDLMEQMEEVEEKMKEANEAKMELLGAPTDYQGVASDWASSWLDAFKETGDGLDSLEESFDELYDNIITGQIQSLVMGPALEKLKKLVSSALADYVITDEERQALENYRDTELAVINKNAKELANMLGYSSDSLSTDTLQKGIEGVTEQTAQALESILNSTRYYVADNNRLLQVIHDALAAEGGENTILTNVRAQTKYLRTLATIADSVYYSGSHAKGAGGIKVFVD